jgi:hypothetical protein
VGAIHETTTNLRRRVASATLQRKPLGITALLHADPVAYDEVSATQFHSPHVITIDSPGRIRPRSSKVRPSPFDALEVGSNPSDQLPLNCGLQR